MFCLVKKYSELGKGSKDKLSSTIERLHKSGITRKEALAMSDSDLKQSLGFVGKKASFEGLKRNIRNIGSGISDKDKLTRKEGLSNIVLPKYVKFGYRGKKLNVVKTELRKTAGLNIFFDISRKVQSQFNLTSKQAYKRTDLIIKKYHFKKESLSKVERQILSFFS